MIKTLEEQQFKSRWNWKKIVKILDQKIRPAVARDGGDIKFKEFKDGIVKVQLQGSCSGCPSSTDDIKTRCSKSFMSLLTRSQRSCSRYKIIKMKIGKAN